MRCNFDPSCIACTLCVWKSNKFIENRKNILENPVQSQMRWDKCKRVKNAKMLITIEDYRFTEMHEHSNRKTKIYRKNKILLHQNTSSFHSVTILKVREL